MGIEIKYYRMENGLGVICSGCGVTRIGPKAVLHKLIVSNDDGTVEETDATVFYYCNDHCLATGMRDGCQFHNSRARMDKRSGR